MSDFTSRFVTHFDLKGRINARPAATCTAGARPFLVALSPCHHHHAREHNHPTVAEARATRTLVQSPLTDSHF